MIHEDQNFTPIKGLTDDEIKVECAVRNIDNNDANWYQTLCSAFLSERMDQSLQPSRPHNLDFKNELKLCQGQVSKITNILQDEQVINEETLPDLKNRIRHWRDRTYRLKGCFHQDNEVDKLINRWRRLEKLYNACVEKVNDLKTLKVPSTQMDSSAALVSTVVSPLSELELNVKSTEMSVADTAQLHTCSGNDAIYTKTTTHLTLTVPQETTFVTWSTNIGGAKPKLPQMPNISHVESTPYSSTHQDDIFSNKFRYTLPSSSYQASINENRPFNVHQMNYGVPLTYQNDSYQTSSVTAPTNWQYLFKQEPKWNISFSGTPQGLDVHDFVFRLESFAWREQMPISKLYALMPKFFKGRGREMVLGLYSKISQGKLRAITSSTNPAF